MNDRTPERRAAFIANLRELATFLEQHPNVPHPVYNQLNVFIQTPEELASVAKGGSWSKQYNGPWFYLERVFGEDLALHIDIEREKVCRKVVVGKRLIAAQPEHEVEDVEWQCEPVTLLGHAE